MQQYLPLAKQQKVMIFELDGEINVQLVLKISEPGFFFIKASVSDLLQITVNLLNECLCKLTYSIAKIFYFNLFCQTKAVVFISFFCQMHVCIYVCYK